jgi:polar amino acid transport system substrate-binding protein
VIQKFILIITFLLTPLPAGAETLPVVCQEFPPYNYLHDNGKAIGSSTETVTKALQIMGYEANIRMLPWNRAYAEAAEGKAALLFTFSKSAEREKDFFFTDSLASIEVVFFKRKTDDITWEGLRDLKDYRIGYVQGYNYGSTFMEAIQEGVFNRTDLIAASTTVDYQQLLKLATHRIDLAVCPKKQCTHIITMNLSKFSDLDYINKSIGPAREFYGGFSKKWPNAEAMRDQFNQALRQVKFKREKNLIH